MPFRFTPRLRIAAAALLAVAGVLALVAAYAPRQAIQTAHAAPLNKPLCTTNASLCTETVDPWNYAGQYTGHDEPSLLFYHIGARRPLPLAAWGCMAPAACSSRTPVLWCLQAPGRCTRGGWPHGPCTCTRC
ncbi:MAG TPA: hypothetical protein VGS80_04210, partial [Ktedonobacterales bacterium]|nr:hypothetical protein [Ktedonobacterales bacterium]